MTTAPIPAIPDEWDDDTLALLKADDGPHTVSELVLVPGYSQSEWDRRQVRQLKLIDAAAAWMRANQHKTPEVLIRDALLILEWDRAARAYMSTGFTAGPVFGSMAAKPKRKRPSQARKTVTGGT